MDEVKITIFIKDPSSKSTITWTRIQTLKPPTELDHHLVTCYLKSPNLLNCTSLYSSPVQLCIAKNYPTKIPLQSLKNCLVDTLQYQFTFQEVQQPFPRPQPADTCSISRRDVQTQGNRGRGEVGCSTESSKAPWLPIPAGCSSSPVLRFIIAILTHQIWTWSSFRNFFE